MKKEQRTIFSINMKRGLHQRMMMFAGCMLLAGNVALASGSPKVTLQFKQARLGNVLSAIGTQTGLRVEYNDKDVDAQGEVSIDVKDMDVMVALNRCLEGSELSASIRGNTILVSSPVNDEQVKGVVVDATEQLPMVGVNVAVVTKRDHKLITGVVTDADGRFAVTVPDGALIRITSVGYKELILPPPMEIRS